MIDSSHLSICATSSPTARETHQVIEKSSPNSKGSNPRYRRELTQHRGELAQHRGELTQHRGEFIPHAYDSIAQQLPQKIADSINALGPRLTKTKLRAVILEICSHREWSTVTELAHLLDFVPANLVERHLSPMVKDGTLIRRYPESPTHPAQAYQSASRQRMLLLPEEQTQ
jgi:hypothetical protein